MAHLIRKTVLRLLALVGIGALLFACHPAAGQSANLDSDCPAAAVPASQTAAGPGAASVYVGTIALDPTTNDSKSYLYALRASDGSGRWQCASSTRGGFEQAPVLVNGIIYTIAGRVPSKGLPNPSLHALYALRASDGALLWHFARQANLNSQPIVAAGVVYLSLTVTTGMYPTSDPHMREAPYFATDLYALRASDGALLWQSQIGSQGVWPNNDLFLARGILYAGAADGSFVALNASDGTTRWRYQANWKDWPTLMVANGQVYVRSGATLSALEPESGALLWRFKMGDYVSPMIAAPDGVVYGSSASSNANKQNFYALDTHTGRLIWRYQADEFAMAPAAMSNGIVYATAVTPQADATPATLYALRASDGSLLWRYHEDGFLNQVQIINGVVYVGGNNPYTWHVFVSALRATDGYLLWRYQNGDPGGVMSDVNNGVIYLTTEADYGYVSALRANDGALLWRAEIPHKVLDLTAPSIA